jgi:hypothetical protein
MNALYLGPYRQNNDEGILSRLYLNSICEILDTTSRPIYINAKSTDIHTLFKSEINHLENLDVLIQHLPINSLAINKAFHKNICIPIVDNTVLINDQIDKLNLFDKIWIDNLYLYKQLSPKIKPIKYKLIRPDISNLQIHSNKFNLSSYDFTRKIYAICDFQSNLDLIYDLCLSFLRINKEISNLSLILFIYNIDNVSIQNISNKIKDFYSLYENKTNSINIIPISINNDLESLILCHNTGDIFLDVSENNKTSLNYYLATQMNKKILDISDIDMSITLTRNNLYSSSGFSYINTDIIYNSIKNILISNSIKNTNINFKPIDSNTL